MNYSSTIVEFWLNSLPPFLPGLFLHYFVVHYRYHFGGFSICRHSPVLFSTLIFLLYRSPFILPLFFFFFDADVSMNPIDFILFGLISIGALFMTFSLSCNNLLLSTCISFGLLQLFFKLVIFSLELAYFLIIGREIGFYFLNKNKKT